jgi:heme exporter protein C
MKHWWKVLAMLLLIYSAIFSFWHPLDPGVLDVRGEAFHPGDNTIELVGYSTHFSAGKSSMQAFLKSGSTEILKASSIEVRDDAHALLHFQLTDTIPSDDLGIYVNNEVDGTIYFTSTLGTEGLQVNSQATWPKTDIAVSQEEFNGFGYPFQPIIMESIRNLMWHVPMWFTMFTLMFISFFWSLRVMAAKDNLNQHRFDTKASSSAHVGLVFCMLGLITGSIWARFTWGAWWTRDPQLNGSMLVFIMYVAYFILRNTVRDDQKRARLSAIFNVFACIMMVMLLLILPRFAAGLHPGKSGNPAFSKYDLDSSLRTVFYPACAGFILLGYWLYTLVLRIKNKEHELASRMQ